MMGSHPILFVLEALSSLLFQPLGSTNVVNPNINPQVIAILGGMSHPPWLVYRYD